MKIIQNIENLYKSLAVIRERGDSIGFVPTMGSLHKGHLSLLRQSIIDNSTTICSIYVNPKQFNDRSDFEKYPRNLLQDQMMLESINCDILFIPNDKEMYPIQTSSQDYSFIKNMDVLEGEKRPGHFQGVLTIVHKLLNLIHPNKVYFGEKDYQQLWLITQLVKTLKIPTEIISCSTVRDEHGLALSSRNQRLTPQEKEIALSIIDCLKSFKKDVQSLANKVVGYLNDQELESLKKANTYKISKNSRIKLDYFEVIDVENFSFAKGISIKKKYRVLVAVYINNIRLIDNILID